jgi:hypothetical protein
LVTKKQLMSQKPPPPQERCPSLHWKADS